MQNVLESMLREMGIQVESGNEARRLPARPEAPRTSLRLRRGVPHTPQVFTPEEGGVSPRP